MRPVKNPKKSFRRWISSNAPVFMVPLALAGGFAAGKAAKERLNAWRKNAVLAEADLSLQGVFHELPRRLVRRRELTAGEGKALNDLLSRLEERTRRACFEPKEQQAVLKALEILGAGKKPKTMAAARERLRFLAGHYEKAWLAESTLAERLNADAAQADSFNLNGNESVALTLRFLSQHPNGESLLFRIWNGRKPRPPRQQPPVRRYKPQQLPPYYRPGRA